jgi:hypothetical protein
MEAASDRRRERSKRLRRLGAAQAPDSDPAPPSDGRFARLEQLGKLRDDGVLDDAEFNREKELVLSGSSS